MKPKEETEYLEKADALAREILDVTRSAVFVRLRFLDAALARLSFRRLDGIGRIATDGARFFYNPRFILARYEKGGDFLARDYLHLLFHCVLQHPFFVSAVNPYWWNLACDAAVEHALARLDAFTDGRERADEAERTLETLRAAVPSLSPEGLYRHFAAQRLSEQAAFDLRWPFFHDDHIGWYLRAEKEQRDAGEQNVGEQGQQSSDETGGAGEADAQSQNRTDAEGAGGVQDGGKGAADAPPAETGGDTAQASQPDAENDRNGQSGSPGQSGGQPPETGHRPPKNGQPDENADGTPAPQPEKPPGETDETAGDGDAAESDGDEGEAPMKLPAAHAGGLPETWKNISRRMQTDLETASRRWGEQSGALLTSIRGVNRDRCDYRAFLRRFSVRGEQMRVDGDAFDYIYYTYGLAHYGNVPLIEPLEYKEVRRVREFAIAIDTSGSCSGDLVQGFIRKTYSLLKQQESFFSRVNIHILQCDAKIQSDYTVHGEADLERYIREMPLSGFGGTDFRPVFVYLDKLLAERAFTDLRGMIYFSDGWGPFPEKKPRYDTAFVFLRDEVPPHVPPWVIPIRMTEDELYDLVRKTPASGHPAHTPAGKADNE